MLDLSHLSTLLACPACRFDGDSPVTNAANLAIGVMLLFLGGVFAAFIGLIRRFARGESQMMNGPKT